MKILLLDLELAPNLATVWSIWKVNIATNQLLETSRVLCWAAKWHKHDDIMFDSEHTSDYKDMIRRLHGIMSEADAIVTYNGDGFDLKVANREFLKLGLHPPSPAKSIDLLKTMKKKFFFVSNKLDHVSDELDLGRKVQHEGHELWLKCMNGNDEAWQKMEEYNKHDVILLERLYDRIRGWVLNHPSLARHSGENCCVKCGSMRLQRRGRQTTKVSVFQRWQCQDCGAWMRTRYNEEPNKEIMVEVK
ncbi:MAG: hypothetical protein D6732_26080 [Methanobacteriota archaeon]|nr:MAG: hypothetical protein D6732_26080 [Euryarchaeota archaeon]